MTNKTKAAIEEAAKLPTAEEFFKTWCNETKRSGGVLIGSSVREFLAAYESHTAAHTAALQERVKELEAENTQLIEAIQHLYICFKRDGVVARDFDRAGKFVK